MSPLKLLSQRADIVADNYFMNNLTKKTLSHYWAHARRYPVSFGLAIFGTVGASLINVIVPLYFKKFFDELTLGGEIVTIARVLLGVLATMFVLELTKWVLGTIMAFATSYFETRVLADLSDTCFRYLHRHSFTFFNNNFVGSLVKRVNWFVRAFEGTVDRLVFNLLPLFINFALIVAVLASKNLMLGIIVTVWSLVFVALNWLFIRYKLKYDLARSEAESACTGYLADTITNNNNVKLFTGYDREVKGFVAVQKKLRDLRVFTWNLNAMVETAQNFLMVLLEISAFYYGIILWKAGQFTTGDFVLLQSYVLIVFMKIWDFGRIMRYLYQDLADAEEMTEILNTPHEIVDKPRAKDLKVTAGKIEFNDVSFSYNETRTIFKKFNFVVSPQEKVALVGPSGAGKSTIVKLILRMHDVDKGKILIDGQNIAGVKMQSLWAATSWVPQDPILFHRGLMENIRYGRFDATDEEVYAAAKLAHCHEFISGFPDGYNTFVGERGVKLSGGERQRVAIARAILRNAPILIMDEATSSLDSESEKLIQDALTNLMKNKTVITVAHRLSTIMKMDRIVVIGDGGIVEQGTHAQLLRNEDGVYKRLWSIQAGGFIA